MTQQDDSDKTRNHIALTKGTMVSHYRIVEKIGAGGMGEVYLAEDTKLNRKVALKFLPPHLCRDKDCRARFKREAQAAAKLDHPNIVTIHEVNEYQGRPFFAMQHLEGESLHDLIKGKELPVDRVIGLSTQICDGLTKAHQAGITHRDIKPSNIVIDADGRPRLVDFGLAAIKGGEQLTKTGSTLGTVSYMSPEQVQGKEVDHRSDLFAFGVVLYELICGKRPFEGDSETATMNAINNLPPQPLSRYRADVPDDLQRIVSKLLEKDPGLRYQSADGVAVDMRRLVAGSTTGVMPAAAKPRFNKVLVGTVVLLLAVIVAGTLYKLLAPERKDAAESKKMLAVLPFENLGNPEDEYFADGITDEITSRLASVHVLGVISRTSAYTFKNSEKTLPEIARQLGVDYILEGTIRWDKTGDTDRVRITPQLIRVSDDRHLWADNYERDLTQVFTVQSEIAGHVAAALNVALGEPERLRIETEPTTNVEAYVYFLRGREYFERGGQRNCDELAIRMWERAIELDSSFALAYAWLARAHSYSYFNWPDKGSGRLELAKNAAETALRLSDQSADGHMAMGYYYYYSNRNYDRALEHFLLALREQPNNSDLHGAVAYIQRRQGKWEEALVSLRKAARLNPRSVELAENLQITALFLRRYTEAKRYFDLGRQIAPDDKRLYDLESWRCITVNGDTRQARQVLEEGRRLVGPTLLAEEFELLDMYDRDFESALGHRPSSDAASPDDDFDYFLFRGWLYSFMGRRATSVSYFDSARVKYEQAVAQAPDFAYHRSRLAIAYAGVGRTDDAIRECETAMGLLLITEDALLRPMVLATLADAYILTGKHELAIETLDSILSMPFVYSVQTLRLDPRFDPLRDHPRFQALIEKYEKEHGN
ncbi:MAG: protein kinase [bacterium]